MSNIPKTTKGIVIKPTETKETVFKNDAVVVEQSIPELLPGQVLVKVNAVAFNHKDVWMRKGLYPGITPGSFYGGDGAGIVVASGTSNDELVNQRVFLTPSRGWWSNPDGPESKFYTMGGAAVSPGGTFAEYLVVDRVHLIRTPSHLDDVQAAAWPLGGVTSWRATMVNAKVQAGQNVLITGIGGGVALLALQLCIAAGASVYVTSGNPEKLERAVALGAKGGANYKDANWPAEIHAQLQKERKGGVLDSVIDSGGGDILGKVSKILKPGGKVVCYGMTAGPKITMTMREVLFNQQLIGSTMGSHKDLEDATAFLTEHKIVPVISQVLDGLESAEQGFQLLNRGDQFGKVVIKIRHQSSTPTAKL
ncbi:NAD(P)-binding protein [Coprinopsis marcescibilis]|uniref:NAD(P)-binding protein n=1 Tax=Coprinopsis marcescibilis TaxID=230819 RepID=A0A5C3KJR1_COPMA|nr:NAD(P)-binding protein [Coprinopsis marcescibilis]